jgi:hypothetical protein
MCTFLGVIIGELEVDRGGGDTDSNDNGVGDRRESVVTEGALGSVTGLPIRPPPLLRTIGGVSTGRGGDMGRYTVETRDSRGSLGTEVTTNIPLAARIWRW